MNTISCQQIVLLYCTCIGPPLAPPFNLTQRHLISDAIQHILEWSEPYTHSDFPITNYTVSISDHLNKEYITVTKSNDSFTYTHTSYGKSCLELDFALTANNRAGQGDTNYIHSGHPVGMLITINAKVKF